MLTIHGSTISPFVRKTLVCLIEKGIDYELNPTAPFPLPEPHPKLPPLREVPALIDGDQAIPDSAPICRYLEGRFPDRPLFPSDAADFDRALWFEDWADKTLPRATVSLFSNRVALRMLKREPDEAAITQILSQVLPPFELLESEIGDKAYLVGDQLSIADIAVTCHFIQMQYVGEALPAVSHPNVTRYVTTHMQRKSFRSLVDGEPFMKVG